MEDTQLIPVDKIRPNRYQPRLKFDEQALVELAQSIQSEGLIQPVVVRAIQDHYEIIAGERRYRACIMAGLTEIKCNILTPTEDQAQRMALIENIQREDLTAIEEAKAYVQIMRQEHMTQERMAEKIGKSQSAIANKIRLLNLPQEIQEAVLQKKISERHARALLALDGNQQIEAYHHIVDRGLNVRQAEAYVEGLAGPNPKSRKPGVKGFTRNTQVGINSVNQCVRMIRKTGIDVTSEIEETLTDVRVIIRFPK